MKSEYPVHVVTKNIKKYFLEKRDKSQENENGENCKYFKLPYIKGVFRFHG